MTYGQRQVTKSLLNDAGQVLERSTELRSTTGSTLGYVDAVRFAYDNNGRTVYQSQGGRTTWYTYDDDKSGTGLVTKEALSDGGSVRDTFFTLDSAGQTVRKSSSRNVTTMDEHRWSYDALGRIVGEKMPVDKTSTVDVGQYDWLTRSTIYSGLVTKVIDQDGHEQVMTQGVDSSVHEFTSQVVAAGLNKSITRAFRNNADGSLKQAKSTQVVSSTLSVTSSLAYLYNEFAQPTVKAGAGVSSRDPLRELSALFGLSHPDSASDFIRRGAKRLEQSKKLARHVSAIKERLGLNPESRV